MSDMTRNIERPSPARRGRGLAQVAHSRRAGQTRRGHPASNVDSDL